MTQIPAIKADREHRPDSCLHCTILTALEEWFQAHGERVGSQVRIDVVLAVSKLTECAVEIIQEVPDRSGRRRAMRFAHDALDAALKSQITGKQVAVDIPTES